MEGIGVHTGALVKMTFCPAPIDHGIVFQRVDLPGAPLIPATVGAVSETMRSTTISSGDAKVHTVEHVMAALAAYEIDNILVEVSALEPPIGDGSSLPFIEMIERAGIAEQEAEQEVPAILEPVYSSDGPIHLVALPFQGFRISYTLHYPTNAVIGSQYFSLDITKNSFCSELAPCRTFSLYEEVAHLMDRGLIRGASLSNGVVVKDDAVLSKAGLRFPNEMVRHKMLDLVGDLALVGPFQGHIIAIRAGHAANHSLAKKIYEHLRR